MRPETKKEKEKKGADNDGTDITPTWGGGAGAPDKKRSLLDVLRGKADWFQLEKEREREREKGRKEGRREHQLEEKKEKKRRKKNNPKEERKKK